MFIIKLIYHRKDEDLAYYYRGQNSDGPVFELNKNLARRYDFESDAIRDMKAIENAHCTSSCESIEVIPIQCKV